MMAQESDQGPNDCFDRENVDFGSDVSDEVEIVRFYSMSKAGYDPSSTNPPTNAFMLSTDDKQNKPPHLSVWDLERTPVGDACHHLNTEKSPYAAYKALTHEVNKCEDHNPVCSLSVIRTPLKDDGKRPGSNGHCGITGMPEPVRDKKSRKRLRILLVARFTKMTGDFKPPDVAPAEE